MTISASQLRLTNNLEPDSSGGLRIASALAAFGLLRTGAFALAVDSANLVGAGIDVDEDSKFRLASSAVDGTSIHGGGGEALSVNQGNDFNFTSLRGTLSANLEANGQRVVGLAAPSSANDAATKVYVDSLVSGLDVRGSVFVASDANITLSGAAQTLDGVAVPAGKRVLVMGQTTGSENGIYVSASDAWSRSTDFDGTDGNVTASAFTFVEQGTKYGDTGWTLSTDGVITVGTTPLAFTQFSSAGVFQAGNGLTKAGNTLNVVAGDASLIVHADDLVVGRDTNGAIGLSGGGLQVNVIADSMQISGNNLGVRFDNNGGLQAPLGGSGVGIKLNSSSPFALSSSGLDIALDTSPGLQVSAQKLSAKADGAKGVTLGANGIGVKVDGATLVFNGQGQASIANGGVDWAQLADNGVTSAKLKSARVREDYGDSGWTYADSVNSRTVGATPDAHAKVIQDQVFMRNGVETGFKRVTGAPANEGEWRLNGTTLQVFSAASFGDSGDSFTAKFHA